jgi:hypothetical protein
MKPVVLIPCYRSELSPAERISLRQCRHVLAAYDCKVILPEGLALPEAFAGLEPEYFPAGHFKSVQDYSCFLLNLEFYDRFRAYDYMLIYHLDAYVFRDELDFWCAQGFDYIGAPWGNAPFLGLPKMRKGLPWHARPLWLARWLYRQDFRVGNGGLSLRRIAAFQRVLQRHAPEAARWPWNEDVFWSLVAPVYDRQFRIPTETQAMRFALELEPRRYVDRMGGRLPFGCHAWERYDPAFWAPHISRAEER